MARIMAVLGGGVLIGILATLAVVRFGQPSEPLAADIVRDIVDVPAMAQATAEQHRDEQYISLTGIEQILALPTEFARSEALFVLAGRSDSASVQNLIFEANRIADDVERVDMLEILFYRLAEADGQSALALARMDQFKIVKSIERTVWRAWARYDLDEALFAAKTQTTRAHQNFAARSLYYAFDHMGNATTDRIEAELGIGPDRNARGRYLYQLADKSPARAIEFINSVERNSTRREYISWLAYHISTRGLSAAAEHASLFEKPADGEYYKDIFSGHAAQVDPKATIDRILAGGAEPQRNREYNSAVSALVSTDLEAAKQYFDQAQSENHRWALGSAIAAEMANIDSAEALAWARAKDTGQTPKLEMTVIRQIASTDPQLAITEALNSSNNDMRSNILSYVMQQVAQDDPAGAVGYLDQIQDQIQRISVSEQIASAWIRTDAEAAINWVLGLDDEIAGPILQRAGQRLLHENVDLAIRLLPRLDESTQVTMRMQIAQQLAGSRSLSEAYAFIRQFQGQPSYDQLQASVITGAARSDPLAAKQLADQLADGPARDQAYTKIISQRARTNPVEALSWLNSVSNEHMRSAAAGQLAGQWYKRDPAAATRWVSSLPDGSTRDDAIMHIASNWGEPTVEQKNLIASIGDSSKRGQAKVQQVFKLMQTDPARAMEALEDPDINSEQREQLKSMMLQSGYRF